MLGTIEDPVAIGAILDSLAVSAALLDRPPPAAMMEPTLRRPEKPAKSFARSSTPRKNSVIKGAAIRQESKEAR